MVCNRKEAKVFEKANAQSIFSRYIPKSVFEQTPEAVIETLESQRIDFIVLAGFLLLIPLPLVQAFPGRILNIHPALLPAFGGKGMYGNHVHKAVKESGVSQTGATIHLVDEAYDQGKIIFQVSCPVFDSDTESDIAARVLKLEHSHYAFVIEQFIASLQKKNTISK